MTLVLDSVDVALGDRKVLRLVDLVLGSGEMIYLVGKSGQGKSSLIRALIGDLRLEGTKAEVLGTDLLKLKASQLPALRRKIGVVFQDFQLLTDRTVDGNLQFVLEATGWTSVPEMSARKEEVLNMVGLAGRQREMPHRLSGGEQQKLAIARALLNKPALLLADEPTGQLDPDSSEEVLALLVDINKRGTALLMATHDYLTIDRFPARVVRCEAGKLVDLGRILFEPLPPPSTAS
jgi:cell division transport system ATP-binding protein